MLRSPTVCSRPVSRSLACGVVRSLGHSAPGPIEHGDGGNGLHRFLTWTSTFDAKGVPDAEAAELIVGIYRAGFENVGKLLGM